MATSQVDGFGRDGPSAVGSREQPFAGALGSPIPTQQFQQLGRQQSLPVLVAFALTHPQQVAASVDVPSLELSGLGNTEPTAVQHRQNSAVAKFAGGFE